MGALRFQSLRKLQRLSEYMGSVGVDGGQGDADPEFGDYDDHEQLGVSGFGDTAYSTCHTSGIAGGVPGCDFSTGSPFWVSKVRVEYLQDSYAHRTGLARSLGSMLTCAVARCRIPKPRIERSGA